MSREEQMLEKLPPFDGDAEAAVIGSLLIDPEAMLRVSDFLTPQDFYRDQNRWVYEACCALFQQEVAINQITVAHELVSKDKLEIVGGPAYLAHLVAICPTSLYIKYYAQIVQRLGVCRRIIVAAGEIARKAYEGRDDVSGLLQESVGALIALRSEESRELLSPMEMAKLLEANFEQRNEAGEQGMALPWGDVSEKVGAMQGGELWLLGARPGIGKTTFLQQVLTHVASQGKVVLFCSVEMAAQAIGDRLVQTRTGIPIRRLQMGKYGDEEWEGINDTVGWLSDTPIWWLPGRGMTTGEIRRQADEVKVRGGLDCIMVDYLQILGDKEGESENIRISNISRNLKVMAEELGVPVMVASQLNRGLEARESKRPTLADLRGSGSLEQDSDVVLFLHRDDAFYTPKTWKASWGDYPKGIVEVIPAKHRQWGIDGKVIKLIWLSRERQYGMKTQLEVDGVDG